MGALKATRRHSTGARRRRPRPLRPGAAHPIRAALRPLRAQEGAAARTARPVYCGKRLVSNLLPLQMARPPSEESSLFILDQPPQRSRSSPGFSCPRPACLYPLAARLEQALWDDRTKRLIFSGAETLWRLYGGCMEALKMRHVFSHAPRAGALGDGRAVVLPARRRGGALHPCTTKDPFLRNAQTSRDRILARSRPISATTFRSAAARTSAVS